MKRQKTFRIDKLFGLATLICLLAIALMVYNDFFRTTTGTGKETETQSRTSGYLNDNKNIESKGASSKAVVCLDASRGGLDSGLGASGKKEKDINLDMTLAVKSKLEAEGVNVVMTRTTDTDVTDEDRVKASNSSNAYEIGRASCRERV